MNKYYLIVVVVSLAISWLLLVDNDSMETCQRTHSYDTCHHTLYN